MSRTADPRKGEWPTPKWLVEEHHSIYTYDLDAAASKENALFERFYTQEVNALQQPWSGRFWCNPPYGQKPGTDAWVEYARKQALTVAELGTILIPYKPETDFIHDLVLTGVIIGDGPFIDGRGKTSRLTRRWDAKDGLQIDIRQYRQRVTFGDTTSPGWFASISVTYQRVDDPAAILRDFELYGEFVRGSLVGTSPQ